MRRTISFNNKETGKKKNNQIHSQTKIIKIIQQKKMNIEREQDIK